MVNLRTKLLAIGFILILSSSAAVYYYLDQSQQPDGEDPDQDKQSFVDLRSTFEITDNVVYRGGSYSAVLDLTVNMTVAIQHMEVKVHDPVYQRTGIQNITINETLNEGSHQLNLSIHPSFPGDEGVVISVPNVDYPLQEYTLYYNTTNTYNSTTEIDNIDLRAIKSPIYDQAKGLDWNSSIDSGTVSINQGDISILPSQDSNFSLSTEINTTGYTRLDYSLNSTAANFVFIINGSLYPTASEGYLPLGNLQGMHNLTLVGEIGQGGSLNISLQLLTKAVTLFVAVGNNHWQGQGSEEFIFREPRFYIEQVSYQIQQLFNVTLVHGKTVDISSPLTRNYNQEISQWLDETGSKLSLDAGNWTYGQGSFEANEGFDILLLFTNRTMDYLGIVYGNLSGSFNMAIHARGSSNTGNYRLPPSFADNLVQHEVSHVFGAPDRFTDSSPPSVMTKSRPDDAVDDIIFGTFWLYLTNWLEEDIQTMTDENRALFWN